MISTSTYTQLHKLGTIFGLDRISKSHFLTSFMKSCQSCKRLSCSEINPSRGVGKSVLLHSVLFHSNCFLHNLMLCRNLFVVVHYIIFYSLSRLWYDLQRKFHYFGNLRCYFSSCTKTKYKHNTVIHAYRKWIEKTQKRSPEQKICFAMNT